MLRAGFTTLVIRVDKLPAAVPDITAVAQQVTPAMAADLLFVVLTQEQVEVAQGEIGLMVAAVALEYWGKARAEHLGVRGVLVELTEPPLLLVSTVAGRVAMTPGLRAEEELFVLFGLALPESREHFLQLTRVIYDGGLNSY